MIQEVFSRLKELGSFYAGALEQPLRRLVADEERILELIQENPFYPVIWNVDYTTVGG